MKFALAFLLVIIALANSQDAPTSASSCPDYNLSNYKAWECNSDAECLSKFPTYTTLSWAPIADSAVWESGFWRWTVNTNPSLSIKCGQDFFPYGPQYKLCKLYHPEYPNWSADTNPVYCAASSWMGTCQEGQSVWSAELNASVSCCIGNGPAVAW